MFRITKGLDIPIDGKPAQTVSPGPEIGTVALVADDYVGLKPRMAVEEGDRVRRGQALFADKRDPDVRYTAPAAGVVAGVHRGQKRKLLSVVIDVRGDEEEQFATGHPGGLGREQVCGTLAQSGLWTALRTRPFNRVPLLEAVPRSIFVTAMDTRPLAADPTVILAEAIEDFVLGLEVLSVLTEGTVYVCHAEGAEIPGADVPRVRHEAFRGPHPAGLPGTHIHLLDPVGPARAVWFIGYQDVIAFGTLFRTGRLGVERVVALGGPSVTQPRLLRTCVGASLDQLVDGELRAGTHRVISGSVLAGRRSVSPQNFLGRYHNQVSVLPEGGEREFLGWQRPGRDLFSVTRAFASSFLGNGKGKLQWNTSTHGSRRAMVPIGVYEKVMPLDILPTQLLRALIVGDMEAAQELGCLELDEDDVALCTFVCPSKYEYGTILRENLTTIEREG